MPARRTLIAVLVVISIGTIILMAAQGLAQRQDSSDGSAAALHNRQAEPSDTTDTTLPDTNNDFHDSAKEELSEEQYNVCFLKGTEPPGSGEYYKHFEPGTYHCAVCKSALFESETKYDSRSGWPAFYDAASNEAVATHTDTSLGMRRVEITCAKCGSHLGHVFDDGPAPTGKRYCVNSLSLEFVAKSDRE